jgi:hypothetical protein
MNMQRIQAVCARVALLLTWPLILLDGGYLPIPIGLGIVGAVLPIFELDGMNSEGLLWLMGFVFGTALTIVSCWTPFRILLLPGATILALLVLSLLRVIPDGRIDELLSPWTFVSAVPFVMALAWAVIVVVLDLRQMARAAASGSDGGRFELDTHSHTEAAGGRRVAASSWIFALSALLITLQFTTTAAMCFLALVLNPDGSGWETGIFVLLTFVLVSAASGVGGTALVARRGLPRAIGVMHRCSLVCLSVAVAVGLLRIAVLLLRG